jgi:hypothetical protein
MFLQCLTSKAFSLPRPMFVATTNYEAFLFASQ